MDSLARSTVTLTRAIRRTSLAWFTVSRDEGWDVIGGKELMDRILVLSFTDGIITNCKF
jgi:hypothetical protein